MEWCKLFADIRGKHHWSKLISDKDLFSRGLLNNLNISEESFSQYIAGLKKYRDKFIAHLDQENIANIPVIKLAEESTIYLYNYIIDNEDKDYCTPEAPKDPRAFFNQFLEEGKSVIQKNKKTYFPS
jgi:hypothetical protein